MDEWGHIVSGKEYQEVFEIVIGDQVMTFSELQTGMFEVSQIVNQRPIGRIPTQTGDDAYICPNALLIGRASPTVTTRTI